MDRKALIKELGNIPEPLLNEVYDFVTYLKSRAVREYMETTFASESSLKRDWLKPKEDKAWQSLQYKRGYRYCPLSLLRFESSQTSPHARLKFGVSEGMVLAAGPGGKDLWLLSLDDGAQPGMRVK